MSGSAPGPSPPSVTGVSSMPLQVFTGDVCQAARVQTWSGRLGTPVTLGGEGPGADPDIFALLYKNVFGAKVKLVTGYHGTNDTVLAMERGEVDGLCGLSWSTLQSRHLE